ncbi:MAG: tetratricopeptide repeat protein [Verrucomicrobia bacterium]|nr:tetratricopeptide repeat protein [Verrucomicrobiota bacterium]
MKSPDPSRISLAAALVCSCLLATGRAGADPTPLAKVQAELRALHFDQAIAAADQALNAKDPAADELLYLKASAQMQAKKFADAIVTAARIAKEHPQSGWSRKAVFLTAQALVEQKKFAEAAAIYEVEAARILSPERKQELVGEILRFAEKLEAKPDPNVPDAPKQDFAKAYSLYTKALAMELTREFRDDIFFRKARAIQQAGNAAQAIQDFQAYLSEYDPAWTGPAGSGSPRPAIQNPPPAGKHVAMARYRLAEASHQSGNPDATRMELDDLMKLIDAKPAADSPLGRELATPEGVSLTAEIRWLRVQTYFTLRPQIDPRSNNISQQAVSNINTPAFIGNTGGLPTNDARMYVLANGDLDNAIKTCRDYLANHPAGSRSVRTAWMIAEALQSAGRADDAITAYREFIAGKGFRLPDGDAATAIDEELRAAPATHLANLKMRALHRIGQIQAGQRKYEDAIATWQTYIKEHPNGSEWSACQNAIIDAEFQLGLDALTDRREDQAMQRFSDFLRAHPLDERAPRILYLFGALHESRALDAEEAKSPADTIAAHYRAAIDEWAKLVSKYPESAEARAAMLKSGKLLEEKLGEFERALKLYQKLATERGDGEAAAAVTRLTRKSLEISAERVFRTNEKPVVRLNTRNIEQCEVRIYRIDLQAYFRKMHGITGVEGLDVSLIQPDKTWTHKAKDYRKYQPLSQEVEIPFPGEDAGACVVTIGDDDFEATVLVLRSDLELIVKSSRREVLAFVQNVRTQQPAAGVDVLVSDGKGVAATGKTGNDGVYKTPLDSLKDLSDVRVFALRAGNAASYNLPLAGLELSSGLTAKGYLYTDRPAYLPGETVSMRGVLRDVKDGSYAIPGDPAFKIRFSDPQGRLLSEQSVKLSAFGTFDATLELPAAAALGEYTMTAVQERKDREPLAFQGTFTVREFKLEKIRLSMDTPRRVLFRGEKLEATLQAAYYWGEPLANREIRCTLPDRRIERLTTDAEGRAKLSFDTTGMVPGSQLTLTASLDGDNVTLTESFTLARLGFSIKAEPSQPVVIAGEPFDLGLTVTAADGKPAGESLKVTVLRIEKPRTHRILTLLPWPQPGAPATAPVTETTLDAKSDPATGKCAVPLKLEKGGAYQLRIEGTDRFGQAVSTTAAVEVSDASDANKLRLFADSSTLKAGTDTTVRLHSRMASGLALVTFEGETILSYRILNLHQDYNDVPFKVGHDLFPNFRLAVAAIDGRDLRLTTKDFTVERELKVAVRPLKEAFLPGEEGKVELTVTDQTGQPVVAELSMALVNEALYAVCPDTTAPILDFFQNDARRHADFHVGATCGFAYPGTTRAVSKAVTDEKQRLGREELEAVQQQQALQQMDGAFALPTPTSAPEPAEADPFADSSGVAEKRMINRAVSSRPRGQVSGGRDMLDESAMSKLGEVAARRKDAGEAPARREVRGEGRWLPSVVTGKDGKAVATVKLPETTTAWRLTARGCTVETLVGQNTAATLTRKDFFVELKLPSFLREGDEIRATGRVHNLSDFAGTVPLTLRVLDAKDRTKVLATREAKTEVKAKGGAEIAFESFAIPAALEVEFELSGAAGDLTDKLVRTVPVSPWGLPYATHSGGTADADTATVLRLPEGRAYNSTWMTVAVGPDLRTSVLDMALRNAGPLDGMARLMPPVWGVHPANDLLATASALAYANSGNPEPTYQTRLAGRARALVAGVVSAQAEDGSWKGDISGPYTTARVFWALITARKAGLAVHQPTLDKAAEFLTKQLAGFDANDNDSKAIVLHALSCDKRADFAACNRLYRDRNTLGTATLAYLTRAFYQIDRREIAAELAGILETKVKDGVTPLESGCKIAWLNDAPETTALVLLALAESKPESPKTQSAAQALMQAHGCFGFSTDRARGPAVAALATFFGLGKEQATDLEITVRVNGTDVGTVKAAGSPARALMEVPSAAIKADKTVVEFRMKGRGRYTYAATLFGFSKDTKATGDQVNPGIDSWSYYHAPLEYRGKPINVASTSPVGNLEHGKQVRVQVSDHHGYWFANRWFVLDIPLPAGATLMDGSLSVGDNIKPEIHDTFIRVYFVNRCPAVGYVLNGYTPGKFRTLPTVIREVGNPGFMAVGPATNLTVLAPGEKSPDPFVMNIGERFALGQCHFNDGDYATALEYLAAVLKENPKYNESELARMLLWIHTQPKFYDARKIVEMFEVLRERYPSLEIPFDRILVVGRAYKDIGEHERSWLVYRAVIGASFTNDAGLSAVMEDEGRFLGSIDYQEKVWREYPDTAEVVASHFALSQLIYQKAPKAHELPKEDGVQPEKIAMLTRTAGLLQSFLALYPNDPLADDAAFSLCNCVLDLKNYPLVVALGREFAARHAKSDLAPSFQYMTALGLFWQKQHTEALAAAKVVADGESKDRDFARYILGQIYHAEGKPADAIQWYERVKTIYPDAAEAIGYFEKKAIGLEEVTVAKPGAPVSVNLKYRNVREAFVQVYRVDLMKLYLQRKNLSAITSVQLAGIKPESEQTIALGDGKDYVEKERAIPLALKDEAAYLVICRGDDLFASGMVLITPLKIEVQEDPASGRVRANVLDTANGGYRPDVHVKAIGSADSEFRSGETDLRGIFTADNLRGKVTVIARDGDSRYAFFRGTAWLGAPENAPAAPAQPAGKPQQQDIDYKGNLFQRNDEIQQFNNGNFDKQRRQAPNKGIKVEEAY